jgi:hypothetical protein
LIIIHPYAIAEAVSLNEGSIIIFLSGISVSSEIIFFDCTSLVATYILLELEKYFNKEKTIESILQSLEKLDPNVVSYKIHDYHVSFILEKGTFVNFSNIKHENPFLDQLVNLKHFFSGKFTLSRLVKEDSLQYLSVYSIIKPLRCVIVNESNSWHGVPGVFDLNTPFKFSERYKDMLDNLGIDVVFYKNEIILNPDTFSNFKIVRYKINHKFLRFKNVKGENYNVEYKKYFFDLSKSSFNRTFNISKICKTALRNNISTIAVINKQVFTKYKNK